MLPAVPSPAFLVLLLLRVEGRVGRKDSSSGEGPSLKPSDFCSDSCHLLIPKEAHRTWASADM